MIAVYAIAGGSVLSLILFLLWRISVAKRKSLERLIDMQSARLQALQEIRALELELSTIEEAKRPELEKRISDLREKIENAADGEEMVIDLGGSE